MPGSLDFNEGVTAKDSVKEILEGIRHPYPITVSKVKPFGSIWKVFGPSGLFALKRTTQKPAQILQLAQTIACLRDSGFPNIMTLLTAISGQPFALIANQYYLLSPWLDGESPDFTNQLHLQMIAKLYGEFHRISRDLLTYNNGDIDHEPVKTIRDEFTIKKNFLMDLSDSLHRREKLNRIDRLILKWSVHFIRQANFCIDRLMVSNLSEWPNKKIAQGFCHNDPAPRNIIIKDRELFLIDFELASAGLFTKEVAKLLVRALQTNQWSPRIIDPVIEAYTSQRMLTTPEMEILPYFCSFPQHFWRLCNQRFQEQLPWTETHFYRKLWEITGAEPIRLHCLSCLAPDLPKMAL